ncbi:MAG TPA: hypothetical protein VGQ61_11950 [Candidatus Angelobacter sp.]|jgi:hypothetical protein|nr:hypothetical protein [Candidatus Angelobacter sp.]
MMFDLIIIFLVSVALLVAIYTAIQFRGKFPKRTLEDVMPFLRPAEYQEIEALMDPAHETAFRLRMSPDEFAGWQRRRIHLMREYLLRMSHNSLVLIEWGNMEALKEEEKGPAHCREKRLLAQELVQAATEFRLYSMLALTKLKLWLILPSSISFLLPSPSLPSLRNVFGIDALGTYQRLKTAASGLSLAYNNHFHDELVELL